MTDVRDIKDAFSQHELVKNLTKVLHRSVRTVIQEQQHDFLVLKALAELPDRATAIDDSHSALKIAQENAPGQPQLK